MDVIALGPGLHNLTVPTGSILWSTNLADRQAWVRLSLSERESNKTLQTGSIQHGDGCGYSILFKTGETEDYLWYPDGPPQGGPDMDVSLSVDISYVRWDRTM